MTDRKARLEGAGGEYLLLAKGGIYQNSVPLKNPSRVSYGVEAKIAATA